MKQKELFNKALSDALNNYPFSDEETVMKHIRERAKNMKTEENFRQANFREITVEHYEPKKSTRIIHAFAGIAGTAAVLTGAVFGLNWLNEHGGLHEGGIETNTGAGAHDTVAINDANQISENTPDIPTETTGSSAESTLDIESSIDDAEVPSIQENLAELYEANNDIVGWIRIGSTDDPVIDYPVVQADDNDYYLTHNVFKDEVERGAIFADFRNNFDKGLLSGNTVLYGHNMWYGDTMFANLSKYYDGGKSDDNLSFYKENPTVTFNTLYENAEWKIFACVLFNTQEDKGEVYPYDQIIDFADADEFNSFVTDITDRSVLWTDVDLTYGDSILTLSTPYYPLGDVETRVAIFARKVRPGESSEVDVSKASRNPDPLKFEFQYQIEGGSWSSSFADSSQDFYSQDNSKPNNAASDEVVDFLANVEQLVNSSEQIEELKQLLLKIEGVSDVQVYNSDDDSQNTESQITEGKAEKGMVVKVFYDNGESWVQYTKQ